MLGGLFGDDWNDPRSMAALQLGAGLMAAGGPSRNPTNLGMALLGGLNQYQGVMDAAKRQKLLDEEMGLRREDSTMRREEFNAKLAEARRKQQEQEAAKAQFAEWVQTLPPEMQRLAAISPETVIARMFPKDRQPLVTKPGDVIRDPADPKVVLAQNDPDPDKDPEFVRLLRAAGLKEGTPEWNRAMFNLIATKSTHAPGATQNVFTGQMVPAEVGGQPAFVMPSKDGGYTVLQGVQPPGSGKKGQESSRALELVDEAERLIGKATGSVLGTGRDLTLGMAGISTEGAQAAAQLKVLQGALMMNIPRMEGPQSDKDTQLYREMAGQIGDSTLPIETRRAAIRTIRRLNEKYSGGGQPVTQPSGPRRLRYNPQTGTLE